MAGSNSQDALPPTIPTVPVKLTGKNYPFWKCVMSALLKAYGLFDQVEGRIPAPDRTIEKDGTFEPNPAYRRWLTRDSFALTCLLFAVTEEVCWFLVGAETSHDAWKKLSTIFEPQAAVWEVILDRQWYDLWKANLPVNELINSVLKLAHSSAQIGKPKTSARVNQCIIDGLGPEWEPLILALDPRLATMSTDELCARLLDEEARRNFPIPQEQTTPPAGPQADYSAGRNSSRTGRRRGGRRGRGGRGRGGGNGCRSNPATFSVDHLREEAGEWCGPTDVEMGQVWDPRAYAPEASYFGPGPNINPPSSSNTFQLLGPSPNRFTEAHPSRGPSPYSDSSPFAICQLCDEPGHTAPFCRFISFLDA